MIVEGIPAGIGYVIKIVPTAADVIATTIQNARILRSIVVVD